VSHAHDWCVQSLWACCGCFQWCGNFSGTAQWIGPSAIQEACGQESSRVWWLTGLVRDETATLRKGDHPTFGAEQCHRASCGLTCDPMVRNKCGLRRNGVPRFEVTGFDSAAYGACHLLVDGCRIEPVNLHGANVRDVLHAQHMADVLDEADK